MRQLAISQPIKQTDASVVTLGHHIYISTNIDIDIDICIYSASY